MTILATSAGQAALAVIVIVALVALATWLLQRRRRDVWSAFARRRRMQFVGPPAGPSITGRIQGRPVEVGVRDSSSDQDVGGVAVVVMSVGLRSVPTDMTAESVPGLIGDLAALGEDRLEFDEEDFQRDALVKGDDQTDVRDYWRRDRQLAFLELAQQAPCDQVAIRNATLVAEVRDVVSDRARIETLLDCLLEAAPRLDGGDRRE